MLINAKMHSMLYLPSIYCSSQAR